ncbi:Cupin 2 conserved barrel domain protein [Natrinema gari JCM 14663]|uniref:Cupin 2 conserved barrel domain protein n=1 Tax=Natrinema gari JCM 14663 TaxID=1230459 RepID=L9YU14_9EURY|nr:Cupin 2 conserved barrel domain protein [Natrinema gari JCM 14663]
MWLRSRSSTSSRPTARVGTAELVVTDGVLVKAVARGPTTALEGHDHAESTNGCHTLEGTGTVSHGEERERVAAPGVVNHERGVTHGARNETDGTVVFTMSRCPLPA